MSSTRKPAVKRSARKTPNDNRAIDNALRSLEIAQATKKMDTDQADRLKALCRKTGTGTSKARQDNKNKKQQWLDSKQATTLKSKFPKNKGVADVAWSVATGKRLRPKYAEDSADFDKALDYISDKLL